MGTIKIQKISNGHFCTAREFAADFVESIGDQYYRFPGVDTRIDTADATLSKMVEMKSEYLTRMKIFIDCDLLCAHRLNGNPTDNLPQVRHYHDNGKLACYYCLPTLSMEHIETEIEEVIYRQRQICDRYNATEIEV